VVEATDDAQQRAELVSMVSHELRGPISTIKGLAVTTRTYYDRLPDEEKLDFLQLIEQESDRMLEIVSQASLAMKLSAGVLAMQKGPADLAAIVREGVGAAGLGDARSVELELEEATIDGDRTQLVEVVRQAVQNAGTYSPPDAPITVTLTSDGGAAVIVVADRGPGVPPDKRDLVFTTFPNWRPQGYEEVQGTGLGLFISRALVDEHGGEMSVEDRPGGGTMLRIRLPLEETTRG
jgi:two-component system, OmpR family, sensor histidine kinase KdpD